MIDPADYGVQLTGKEPLDIPAGFVEVPMEQFYAAMMPLDVHPFPVPPTYYSDWKLKAGTGPLVGRSSSGFLWYLGKERVYCVAAYLLPKPVPKAECPVCGRVVARKDAHLVHTNEHGFEYECPTEVAP